MNMKDKTWTSDRDDLLKRLKRAEGQLRGIQKMVATDSDVAELIKQISAVRGAIDKVFYIALGGRLRKEWPGERGGNKALNECVALLRQFGK